MTPGRGPKGGEQNGAVISDVKTSVLNKTHRFVVQPEGHPGYHDNEEGGDVDGDDVVGDLPPESHVHGEAAVGAGGGGHVAVAVLEAVQLEAAGEEEVLDKLHGLL